MKNNAAQKEYTKGIGTYLVGFVASLVLTCIAFGLVTYTADGSFELARGTLIGILALLASIQVTVQVVFFLHMSTERNARWTQLSGLFAVMVVLIIVIGSIWVMDNLNYNMMPKDTVEYMQKKEAIQHIEHESR
ncbi:MAG: cytochrome o ubiquinol oxidase subunit [Patescibacteria group bacterium]|nr:cytochrome o ubiquinol oxidase subunit IV [Candidatus Saccharibacteria bacterium]MDQ5963064.1 cytochrome o ubiquinol oxidase subunit [Patescibacteria group bacterium]